MDGIINILKPPGMTSFDVIAHLRGLLGMKKIGHAGTLDPMAAGVLPVCAGKATRAIEFLMDKDKHYRAELTLGVTTDTQDSTGSVLAVTAPECSDDEIRKAVHSFVGSYQQTPPMYSALKVDGKRLYELARNGIEIERESREVEISSAEVVSIERAEAEVKVLIDVQCSKGTYIRTLCADIGELLGCGGHMSFLLRKRAGPFDISHSHTLEELAEKRRAGLVQTVLQSVDSVFENMPAFILDTASDKKFRNGVQVPVSGELSKQAEHSLIRVYWSTGEFAAIGLVNEREDGTFLKVKKFF